MRQSSGLRRITSFNIQQRDKFPVWQELVISGWTRSATIDVYKRQVLHCPYEPQKAKLVVREMTDLLVLDLVDKGLVTDQMVLTVGYDIENLTDPARRACLLYTSRCV